MQDFTPVNYLQLLNALKASGIAFHLIHDVDARPDRALDIALIDHQSNQNSTYYFRSKHFDQFKSTIHRINSLGHKIGYHYESLATCHGDVEMAYNDFCHNLEQLRQIVPVTTACAHGSPRSPWNNQDIWNQHDIHSLGIDYEPMLDTDFSKTLYLTDTGRRWDGYKVSVRDKVPQYQEQWTKEGLVFHNTDDIIHAINDIYHPIHRKELLINTHPQRWMPFGAQWVVEATAQWWKNQAKRLIVSSNLNQN